tara:strand:- start:133 stop:363 length:231 start_codon:yes stop_codon:yes gene_type:complete
MNKKWFSARETSDLLAFSEATLRRLRQKGILKPGRHYRRKFAGNINSPIIYDLELCEQALRERDERDARTLELARG